MQMKILTKRGEKRRNDFQKNKSLNCTAQSEKITEGISGKVFRGRILVIKVLINNFDKD